MELARGDKETKYVYITVKLVRQQKKKLWLDLPKRKLEKEKKKYREASQNCLFILHSLCLFLSLPWNFWPQLDCKYVSLNFQVSE